MQLNWHHSPGDTDLYIHVTCQSSSASQSPEIHNDQKRISPNNSRIV